MHMTSQTRSQLSDLALTAAIELDRLTLSQSADTSVIKSFFDKVRTTLIAEDGALDVKNYSLFPAYSFAIARSLNGQETLPRDMVASVRALISTNLPGDAREASVQSKRDFCLAFHEALVSDLLSRTVSANKADARVK